MYFVCRVCRIRDKRSRRRNAITILCTRLAVGYRVQEVIARGVIKVADIGFVCTVL